MRLELWAATIFAIAASARELAQNALCGDNVACQNTCRNSRYHIVSDYENNSTYFGCAEEGKANYVVYICRAANNDRNNTATSQGCDASGGRACTATYTNGPSSVQCVVLNDRVADFKKVCTASAPGNFAQAYGTDRDRTFDAASNSASCR
ncbi:MAG: hypothetical protein M1828_007486 [Chrysothrix sp. TS-e1954]|nr:MAG: hypothetical protein M1828_007486 [Chrysothrix sp. TS-e1954]